LTSKAIFTVLVAKTVPFSVRKEKVNGFSEWVHEVKTRKKEHNDTRMKKQITSLFIRTPLSTTPAKIIPSTPASIDASTKRLCESA